MRLARIIAHHFWAKVVTLILAISTWFYVFDLVNSEFGTKETAEDIFARSRLIVKEVPVKPVFTGKSPAGYRVDYSNITVDPATISIFGPQSLIERVSELKTDSIDLSEYTRTTILRLGIRSDVKPLRLSDKVVEVVLPVEKLVGDQ